jgi:CitMHS family citrate-Mg2+:H+ or citrate-Ca2+:H+ symporter
MLTWLGVASIVALLALILFRLTSAVVALALVPLAAALAGGFATRVGAFAMEGILGVAPTAVLLAFAVVYFGVMNEAGLFEPVIRQVVQVVGRDPLKVVLGTAAIATIAHLDGAGASTFLVTVPAMLPIYRRLGMDPLALTCTTAMAAGTMNILPWGGPTSRAAAALQVGVGDLFMPLLPATVAGIASVFLLAALIGYRERRRLQGGTASAGLEDPAERRPLPPRHVEPRRWLFNAALTIATLAALIGELVPLPVVFLTASAVALAVNYPNARQQAEQLMVLGGPAIVMLTTVLAAGVFTGIMTHTGMLPAMARGLVDSVPSGMVAHLPVAVALASTPLSLAFDPDSFYFGVLPVLATATQAAGGSAIEVGRGALLGQMTTGFPVSPLTPATFLLVGLAGVDLADHQRRTIPYVFAITAIMTLAALATGALHW